MVEADDVPVEIVERSPNRPDEIPASIVRAICAIKSRVDAVKKSQYNKHGGYNYASTDDIYASLCRKMGEVGLVSIPLELRNDRVTIDVPDKDRNGGFQYDEDKKMIMKKSHWLDAEVGFMLATAEASWFDPRSKRSEFIQYTGPQSGQALVSFAEKAFLRSLFKLPTGDMDVDSLPQADTVEDQIALAQPVKKKSSAGAKKDGTDKTFNEIKAAIVEATGQREILKDLRSRNAEAWASMPRAWLEILDNEYEDAINACRDAAE